MEILVTGGAGFIGSHLCEKLIANGNRITVVDDFSTGDRRNLGGLVEQGSMECIQSDLTDAAMIEDLVLKSDRVYHLAAAVGVALIAKHPRETIHRNIYPTQLLLDAVCAAKQRGKPTPFFLASTSEVYGKNPKETWSEEDDLVFGATTKPRWSYGCSKAIDEFMALACVQEFQIPVVIGRFFNVVGPRQTGAYGMVLPRFVSAALAGEPLVVHDDGQQQRCFAHVGDVISAVIKLVETPAAQGRIYNIGSDQPISILELAQRVIAITESKSSIEFQSYSEAYDASFEDIRRRVPDLGRIRQTIPFEPKNRLDDIIRDVAASLSDRRDLGK